MPPSEPAPAPESPTAPGSRILLVMRHGKAESSADTDAERDLAHKGVKQAQLIGEYLEGQGVRPTRVLVSTAHRTRQTWDAVLSRMPGFDGKVTFHEELYGASAPDVARLVRTVKDKHQVVLVVGHEPAMSMVTYGLADDDASDAGSMAQVRIGLPTGAMCVLAGTLPTWRDLAEESMTLHTIVRA